MIVNAGIPVPWGCRGEPCSLHTDGLRSKPSWGTKYPFLVSKAGEETQEILGQWCFVAAKEVLLFGSFALFRVAPGDWLVQRTFPV